MFVRLRLALPVLCLLAVCGFAAAETPCRTASNAAPCVNKIEPPNWWTDMPSPMLLVYGRNLKGAHVAVTGANVTVTRTQPSANGHYLFIWLNTKTAKPQTLTLHLDAANGKTSVPFALDARKPASYGFQGFSSKDVMYLIMTDRFADGNTANDPVPSQRNLPRGWHGGDFRGIEEHLGYLKQLGVTTIWVTPIYNNAGEHQAYHGYSATDMYEVDPHFGTVASFVSLARAIHADGMKLVLDTVPNHVGPACPWLNDPPAPGWFHGSAAHHGSTPDSLDWIADPHASWAEQKRVTQGWFDNILPDLNQENPLVSQYLIQNSIWWIETAGLDGLRLDTFPYVDREFWHNFHAELRQIFPRLTTVGEIYNTDPVVTSFFAGGEKHEGPEGDIDTGLYTPFDYPMFFAIRDVLLKGAPMSDLENVLRDDQLYPHPNRLVTFIGNHDTPRFMGVPGATIADLKLGFTLLATLRGMPQLYYGDEIAMRGGMDPYNRYDFPGGFPGDPFNAFTRAGRNPIQQSVYARVSELFHFRAQHPALETGQQQDIYMDDTVFAFVRAADVHRGCTANGGDRMLVVINHSKDSRALTLSEPDTALAGCTSFTPELGSGAATAGADSVTLDLAPEQAGIYEVR